jgi:hypothetical protein
VRRAFFFGAITTVAVVAHATQPPDQVRTPSPISAMEGRPCLLMGNFNGLICIPTIGRA